MSGKEREGLLRPSNIDVRTRSRIQSNVTNIGEQIEKFLKAVAGDDVSFCMVIKTGEETSSYVSNTHRNESVHMMKRTIENFSARAKQGRTNN